MEGRGRGPNRPKLRICADETIPLKPPTLCVVVLLHDAEIHLPITLTLGSATSYYTSNLAYAFEVYRHRRALSWAETIADGFDDGTPCEPFSIVYEASFPPSANMTSYRALFLRAIRRHALGLSFKDRWGVTAIHNLGTPKRTHVRLAPSRRPASWASSHPLTYQPPTTGAGRRRGLVRGFMRTAGWHWAYL